MKFTHDYANYVLNNDEKNNNFRNMEDKLNTSVHVVAAFRAIICNIPYKYV